jgi:hypothetical protein
MHGAKKFADGSKSSRTKALADQALLCPLR